MECIGKGKARKPYEFGVKTSLAITHGKRLIVGARTFPGNSYDGHTLAAQLEQTTTLLQDLEVKPTTAIVDLGFRGADEDIAPIELIHLGKFKRLSDKQRRWLKRRQAVEPVIGHVKQDHGMQCCGQQPALATQSHRPQGSEGPFCARHVAGHVGRVVPSKP